MSEPSEKTLAEMEAGRQTIARYQRQEKIKEWEGRKKRGITVFQHYVDDMVKVVLPWTDEYVFFEEPYSEFPSATLMAQLALILE